MEISQKGSLPPNLQQGRYLLYLDILGFKDIVRTRSPRAVYDVVNHVLQVCARREKLIGDFRTLCFSDTIVFYQKPVGWAEWAFLDIYSIGGMIWSALAAAHIPARGAISFGEFTVEVDSGGRHEIFFGNGLIDAYETENADGNREWVGLTISPSAWQAVECMVPRLIDCFASEKRWRRVGNVLRLNPFMMLSSGYTDYQIGEIDCPLATWNAPEFPNDVKAYHFISEQSQNQRLPEEVRLKYVFTLSVLSDLLGRDCAEWALRIAPQVAAPSKGDQTGL